MQKGVIFFDIGHTLVTGADQSPRRLLSSRLQLTEKEARQVGRLIMVHPSTDAPRLAGALAEALPHRGPAQLQEVVETVWREQVECVREIPGAGPLVARLKDRGYQIGIISNIWHPFYQGFCRTCAGIANVVDFNVLSYRMGRKKPSRELFEQAVESTGLPAGSCWMVGDTYELDMEPAQDVGMRTVWVLARPEKEKTLLVQVLRGEKRSPDWVAENLDEVLAFFMDEKDRPK